MPERFDVYGFRTRDLEGARQRVEEALGIDLQLRDSSYWGPYFCTGYGPQRDYMLYLNTTGEWASGNGTAYGVILLVNNIPRMDDVRRRITHCVDDPVLLRSREYPDSEDDDDSDA